MLLTKLEEIDAAYLHSMCLEHWPESINLEFKRDLLGSSGKDKHELLKDVCGLANSGGGDLIFGIDETEGAAGKIFPITSEGFDQAKRRLGQSIDSGIEPRLQHVQYHHVPVESGYVLIIRVPPQFGGPYRTSLDGNSKFFMRNGVYTAELTYQQLKQAFGTASQLYDKAVEFRHSRLSALTKNEFLRPFVTGPKVILHVMPLQGIAGSTTVNMVEVQKLGAKIVGSDWGGLEFNFNLDGGIFFCSGPDGMFAYVQIYRNGLCEIVRKAGAESPMGKVIPSLVIVRFFREFVEKSTALLSSQGFIGPVVMGGALTGVRDYGLTLDIYSHVPTDRNDLVFPEMLIDDLSKMPEVDSIAKSICDVMWQSFGQERCNVFNSDGKFV